MLLFVNTNTDGIESSEHKRQDMFEGDIRLGEDTKKRQKKKPILHEPRAERLGQCGNDDDDE